MRIIRFPYERVTPTPPQPAAPAVIVRLPVRRVDVVAKVIQLRKAA